MSCELTYQYLHELMTAAEQFFYFSHERMITKKVVLADTIIRHLVWKFFAEQLKLSSDTIAVSYTHLRAPRDGLLSRMPSSA